MKLPQASVLVTVILRLFCVHARAMTVAWHHFSGGNCTVTANWSPKRLGIIASEKFNQLTPSIRAAIECRYPQGFGLRQSSAALEPANGAPLTEARNPIYLLADTDSDNASDSENTAGTQVELKIGLGCSPPIPESMAGSEAPYLWTAATCRRFWGCDMSRREKRGDVRALQRLIQTGSGIPSNAFLRLADFTVCHSQRSVLLL